MISSTLPQQIKSFAKRGQAHALPDPLIVQLRQKGFMRLAPEKPWAPFQADQVIFANTVAFDWSARIKIAPLVWAKVTDAFLEQQGQLKVSLWGVLPIVNARGPSIDQGEAQRYLAELPWCPAAFSRNTDLNYQSLQDDVVRVWYRDEKTYVDLVFDAQGDVVCARSETREREGFGCQPWVGHFEDYREIGGLRVPRRGRVKWETPAGPFEYWRGEIVSARVIAGEVYERKACNKP